MKRKAGLKMNVQKRQRITDFGIRVKKRLIEMDLTQAELCRKTGINRKYFTAIIRGYKPGTKHLETIKKALGL